MNNLLEISSSAKRHHDCENLMGDRIKLHYSEALNVFHQCLNLDKNLATAYTNFLDLKNESLTKIDQDNFDKPILMQTALDKLAGKLYFTVKNKDTISHILFDHEKKVFDTLVNESKSLNPNNTVFSFFNDVRSFYFTISDTSTLSNIWTTADLKHVLRNQNPRQTQINYRTVFDIYAMDNRQYPDENQYPFMSKNFKSITDENKEINSVTEGAQFYSPYNTAHTILAPDDIETIINANRSNLIKNARSAL